MRSNFHKTGSRGRNVHDRARIIRISQKKTDFFLKSTLVKFNRKSQAAQKKLTFQ